MKTKTSQVPQSFSDAIATIASRSLKLLWGAISSIVTLVGQTTLFVVRAIAKVVTACLDTLWEMVVGGIAGGVARGGRAGGDR